MWNNKHVSEQDKGRPNNLSEVVAIDERSAAAVFGPIPTPSISNLNVIDSKKIHIGPKIKAVTQNVHNADMVQGRRLCLDLVPTAGTRGLRCGVAVFVCWAILVATGLIVYFVNVVLPKQKTHLDIELPFIRYLWNLLKNSSRPERLCCAGACAAVVVSVTLIIYFVVQSSKETATVDKPPHEWKITRKMWLAQPYNNSEIAAKFEPLMLVIIQHTVSPVCTRFILCAAELRNMQSWYLKSKDYDIPYNFVIGNDGRVYEGRGWSVEGAHTYGYNRCSLGIGFIGDYREEIDGHTEVTEAQLNRTRMLLEEGVRSGRLRPDYLVVGARDLKSSASPGSNLYSAIQRWTNYDHQDRFKGLTCEQLQAIYGNKQLGEVD